MLPDGFLAQARYLMDWQQYQVFTDPSFDGIGNGSSPTSSALDSPAEMTGRSGLPDDAPGHTRFVRSVPECLNRAKAELLRDLIQALPGLVQHDRHRE